MDISHLSIAELKELSAKVKQQIQAVEQKSLADARQQIQAIAASLGVSVSSLVDGISTKKPHAKSGPVAVKYRDPSDSKNEWSGRGRKPRWVSAYLDADSKHKVEDLAI